MFILLLLILPAVRTQVPLQPNYSPRPYQAPFNAVQFVQHKQAKKGPILFPNDAPPPPPTPLIVTSRPLSESIARSELNPNNSLAAQSQYHQVTYRPNYLARGKNYEPYSYTLATVAPVYNYESKLDYADAGRPVQNGKENFYKDYEKRLMEFIHPRKHEGQPIQHRGFVQPEQGPMGKKPMLNNEDKAKQLKVLHASLKSQKVDYNATGGSDYENEFNEEDNNFDFDFKKLYKTRRKEQLESNTSEYLEYYPDSQKVQRRHFARLNSDTDRDIQIRPLESLDNNSNGNAWHRLSDHEKIRPSDSAEETEEIEQIIGLSTRRSVMRGIKYQGNDQNFKSNARNPHHFGRNGGREKKPFYNSGRGAKPQLRVVKPLYEYNKVDKQQNTAPKADPSKYTDSSEQFYNSKTNGEEHDYNNNNNHGDNYAFSYTVKDHKTGDDFSHSQKSVGKATNGEYRVRLPDGRMQIVSYTADENGYKADVRYDEHHNQDNIFDLRNGKDKEFQNNVLPTTYKHNYGQNDHVVHQDSFENEEILHRPVQPIPTSYKTIIPNNYEQKHFENINDYGNKNDNVQYYNVYPTKSAYVVTTGANIDDGTLSGLSDNNNDYLEHYNTHLAGKDKLERAKEDYKFSDEVDFSKEIVDFSSELDQVYQPHKSKFSTFHKNQNTQARGEVRPSYDELKDVFVTNANGRRDAALPVVSTVRPVYAVTPENIVAITPKKPIHNLYTNIKNIVSATPTPFLFSTPSPSTPRSYLLSTIANLKHQISLGNKPVLSDHYINKINKYLTYTNPSKLSK